jgi:hypothetical protein
MEATFDFIRGVVTLDEQTYRDFLASENVMKRGFLIFLACFFIATFPIFGQTLISSWRGFSAEDALAFQDQYQNMLEMFQPPGAEGMDIENFMDDFNAGVNMGVEIDNLPTPLPRPVMAFFRAVGAWVSAVLGYIGPWLGYGVIVLLIAKLAGGRGILNLFFGLTALYAVPNLLQIFSFLPILGPIIILIALLWGIAVYIRAVQISQDFSGGKAVLITALPILILLLLSGCIASVAFGSLVGLINQAQ